MSRRRRSKKRPVMQHSHPISPIPPPAPEPMLGNRYRPARSSRLSSEEGTSSELASDGVLTAMTSLPASEEGLVTSSGVPSAQGFDNDEEADLQSVYMASIYPQVSSMFRTELPYVGPEAHTVYDDMAASTRSLWAQDLDYREIHGRLYCREFYQPIDDLEQMRWSLIHQVFLHVLDGELTTVPLENPKQILDIGTGTGEWVIKMAEVYPHCEVLGTDIAAIAETQSVPMNAFFEIEDAEDWDRNTNYYDLIHLRSMDGAFKDWRYIYEHVYASLKPGAWIELLDVDSEEGFEKVVDAFPQDSTFRLMYRDLTIAAEKSGRRRGIHHMNPDWLMEAGFVDVQRTEYSLPIHVAEESAGKIWLISCLDAMEACCLRLLTEQLGWDPEKCKAACEAAAREIADLAKDPETSRGMIVKMCVLVGRKPFDALPGSPRSFEMPRSPNQWKSNWIDDDDYRYYTHPTRTEDVETIRAEDRVEECVDEPLNP